MRKSRRLRKSSGSGFTLLEMIVAILVASFVLVALLGVFDFTNKLARAQTQITDVQQSLRSAQYDAVRLVRMAGRGPLPARTAGKLLPGGLAVEVVNNVPAGTRIGYAASTGPEVVPLSDILVIRGVFGSSLFQVNHVDPASFARSETGGTVTIESTTPTGVPQDLAPILAAVCEQEAPDALVLVSPLDDAVFAVVELDPAASRAGTPCAADSGLATSAEIAFKTAGGSHTAAYLALSPDGAIPSALTSVAFLGILEEHRFYVREVFSDPDDPDSLRTPRFSRARVYPGSDAPYRDDPQQWQNDIADNIFELQVALGIDTDGDGVIVDSGDAGDEWLFNHPSDDPGEARWNVVEPPTLPARAPRFYHLRMTTIARTGVSDRGYQTPVLDFVEDHSYRELPSSYYNLPSQRTRRQRRHETVVDMRNIS